LRSWRSATVRAGGQLLQPGHDLVVSFYREGLDVVGLALQAFFNAGQEAAAADGGRLRLSRIRRWL
jgi:hypothetical protein